jgi:phosphoserine phosphatase
MSIAFFDVDETLITGKSMFLFLHRYAEEYPLQCGLTAAAIVRQLQALSKAGQPREAINRYYYSLFRHEPRAQVRAVAEALYREGGYGFHREVVAILRQHQARGDDVVFVSGSMTDILWPAMAALGWSMPCVQSRWWLTNTYRETLADRHWRT